MNEAPPHKPDHLVLLEELNNLLQSLSMNPMQDRDLAKMKLEGLKLKREIVELFNDGVKLNVSIEQHKEQLAFQKNVIDYQHRLEQWRIKRETSKDLWISRREAQIKMMSETVGFAKITLNSLLLVNGGTVLAILAFLGNVLKTECHIGEIMFLGWFIAATFAAILASGLSYITQGLYSEGWRRDGFYTLGHKFRWSALVVAMISLCFFLTGSVFSYNAFANNKIFICDNGNIASKIIQTPQSSFAKVSADRQVRSDKENK